MFVSILLLHAIPAFSFYIGQRDHESSNGTENFGISLEKRAGGTVEVPMTAVVREGLIPYAKDYHSKVTIGSGGYAETFTVLWDSGSRNFFVPGVRCTEDKGCPDGPKYQEKGKDLGKPVEDRFIDGHKVKGDLFEDQIEFGGLQTTMVLASVYERSKHSDAYDAILGLVSPPLPPQLGS